MKRVILTTTCLVLLAVAFALSTGVVFDGGGFSWAAASADGGWCRGC